MINQAYLDLVNTVPSSESVAVPIVEPALLATVSADAVVARTFLRAMNSQQIASTTFAVAEGTATSSVRTTLSRPVAARLTVPRTLPPTFPVTAAAVGVEAVQAVVTLAFMAAVRSPEVAALVRFVAVVIVPAVIFVVLATVPLGNVAARNPVGWV